jgi:hypothetical protein
MRKLTAYIALALLFTVSGGTGFARDDGARELEPASLATVPTPAGLEVHFPFDSAESDDATVIVRDHADCVGEEADKLDLSLCRTVTVWRALIARGMPPALLLLQALGGGAPRVAMADGARKPANRRAALPLWTGVPPTNASRSQEAHLVRSIR